MVFLTFLVLLVAFFLAFILMSVVAVYVGRLLLSYIQRNLP